MIKCSVVIAVYNKEDYVSETLESVVNQTYSDFELVIVNDGSTDRSEEKILEFKDDRINYFKQENKGAAAARNKAIELAKGEYVALLDADDVWEPTFLGEMFNLIEVNPQYQIFSTACKLEDRGKTRSSVYSIPNLVEGEVYVLDYFSSSRINSVLTSSSSIIKRSLISEVGGYDTSIISGQDTDLWVGLGLKSKVVFLNKELATYQFVSNSLSKRSKSIRQKTFFEKYEKASVSNSLLKSFLDLQWFSLCLLAKKGGELEGYNRLRSKIDVENLNWKQKLLLDMPAILLQLLERVKNKLEQLGLRLNVFH